MFVLHGLLSLMIQKENLFSLIALKVTSRDGKAAMEGDVITDARTDFGQFNGRQKFL